MQAFFLTLIKTICEILEIEPLLVSEINKLQILGVCAEEIADSLEFEDGGDLLDIQ